MPWWLVTIPGYRSFQEVFFYQVTPSHRVFLSSHRSPKIPQIPKIPKNPTDFPQIPTDSQCLRGHLHLVLQVHAYHPDRWRRRSRRQEHGGHDPRAEAQVEDEGTGPGARLGRRKRGQKPWNNLAIFYDKLGEVKGKLGKFMINLEKLEKTRKINLDKRYVKLDKRRANVGKKSEINRDVGDSHPMIWPDGSGVELRDAKKGHWKCYIYILYVCIYMYIYDIYIYNHNPL